MAAPDVICKPPDQTAEGMLRISLVSVGGEKIAEGTWHRSCKIHDLFKVAHRSKPGLHIKLLHGSSKLNPQMSLDILDQKLGCILLTVIFAETADGILFSDQQLVVNLSVFKDDGSFVLWRDADSGGDVCSVADELQEGIVQVVGNFCAFAAIKYDGSVVSWGKAAFGGDSSSVADKLQEGVVQVVGKCWCFCSSQRRWICGFVG
ncbi:unnamed protein product [Polarella glacialis]|uniref:Uncharacterized protein n=1 Tax=Polarella glacialis TaxID=89957 RepID=A0A813D7I5_POLGL|nr:unnamed protein product [Polarella glacialis]